MREPDDQVRVSARLGIRSAFALALAIMVASSVLGAAAVFSRQLHGWRQKSELPRVTAMAEVYAAQLARSTADNPAGVEATVKGWSWHADSRLLAVLDPDGQVVAVRGDRELLTTYLNRAVGPNRAAGRGGLFFPGRPDQGIPETALAAVGMVQPGGNLPIGTLVYAARTLGQASGGAALWRSMGLLLVVSVLGAFLGLCLLWHSVLGPLRSAVHSARRNGPPAGGSTPPLDEIDRLVELLSQLQADLDESRAQIHRLEAGVERRVRCETEKVTLRLRQAERKVWLDPLTRLGNRRMLDERFEELFDRQRRSGAGLSLVMMDLDHFKTLNDTLGHKAGDELLVFVGELLRQALREGDLAIRYGGDEFLLILPNATTADAVTVADRLVKLFGQRARLFAFEPKPNLSAGVVSLTEHRPAQANAFIQMADQALYRAKREGKGRVSTFKPGRVTARM